MLPLFSICSFRSTRATSVNQPSRSQRRNTTTETNHSTVKSEGLPEVDMAMARPSRFALVLHGGAGVIPPDSLPPPTREKYVVALKEALLAGYTVLNEGGTSLDATEAAVRVMEDCPLFNAGKGAVFSRDGKNMCEASIMDGRTMKAGATTLLTTVKNPISLARVIKDTTPHVFIAAPEAEKLAAESGLEIVDPSYFFTEHRWKQHLEQPADSPAISESAPAHYKDQLPSYSEKDADPYPQGTVGACALDTHGDLAAATSTGGKTNKWTYRIGDTPLISCGTYAENRYAAVSGTGNGEFFIRYAVAYDIVAQMKYGTNVSLAKAADKTIHETMKNAGGEGGVVAVDAHGRVALPFNTTGMYRGFIKEDGVPHVAIFHGEWY
ncbi:uncharacterized protein SPPG_08080 [Spizellomyces punctatus DAOM BR117]|uniref:beta-aspartyl-peptidase n=1 Tax=Spizellomyces punctatus (strain DAOM BR117) TaxID=645134 RepID=A0A0L0H6F5_SPIPD|nr:uncharacterized protein SPPG_08080 [Spizellomyces punctatus DAOM BR117]KNC96491.1 hypothetical protein SPPG_08080 [Spizellomyces punctatus DAOM BR117]|eukprot:XP_016604531.1 hypothetical protein SPPG_08080 [Spizellomyces punctatus DAOM BR117]